MAALTDHHKRGWKNNRKMFLHSWGGAVKSHNTVSPLKSRSWWNFVPYKYLRSETVACCFQFRIAADTLWCVAIYLFIEARSPVARLVLNSRSSYLCFSGAWDNNRAPPHPADVSLYLKANSGSENKNAHCANVRT